MLMEADDDKSKRDNEKNKSILKMYSESNVKKRLTTGFYLAILWLYMIIIHKNWSYMLNEDINTTKDLCVALETKNQSINFTYGIDVCISDDRLNVSCDERVGILSSGDEDTILVVFMILSCIIESVVNVWGIPKKQKSKIESYYFHIHG